MGREDDHGSGRRAGHERRIQLRVQIAVADTKGQWLNRRDRGLDLDAPDARLAGIDNARGRIVVNDKSSEQLLIGERVVVRGQVEGTGDEAREGSLLAKLE